MEKYYKATVRALNTSSDACIPSNKEPKIHFWWVQNIQKLKEKTDWDS